MSRLNFKTLMCLALPPALAVMSVAACGRGPRDSPQAAKGETPIRYVICAAGGTSCFVAARFKDMDGCESHKTWSGMLCDRSSEPGRMTCTEDRGPTVSVAYCTL